MYEYLETLIFVNYPISPDSVKSFSPLTVGAIVIRIHQILHFRGDYPAAKIGTFLLMGLIV